jgi:hypothetical protein
MHGDDVGQRRKLQPKSLVFAVSAAADLRAATTAVVERLKRDDSSSNRHHALAYCLSMIFSENRYPLFGIML